MTTPVCDPITEAVLKRRAEQLARQPAAADNGDDIEVLVCRVGSERYAVDTASLRSVQWVSGVAPVPCTPSYVLGIVSVRGEIVTLLDLGTMLGLRSAPSEADQYAALLIGLRGLKAGLVVDEIFGVERLKLASLQASLSGREFARGLAPGQTVLLDLEQLLTSGRFDVLDEVV
ncbi:MAG TPA: chemotaxis protein CheW [Chloroflexota bacterium]|jgi:purine-binding chemotaxis protein CheW